MFWHELNQAKTRQSWPKWPHLPNPLVRLEKQLIRHALVWEELDVERGGLCAEAATGTVGRVGNVWGKCCKGQLYNVWVFTLPQLSYRNQCQLAFTQYPSRRSYVLEYTWGR